MEDRCASIEVVEPSVHPCLRNEIWPVYSVFLDQRIVKLEKKSLNFQSGLWWRKDIERVSGTLTISVGLPYRILSYPTLGCQVD
ncbi:hypothetical protein VNO80_15714 [Phaseolus coccineus]|uniref:Uncharacterized protein n=1 Tax=Phaseolus coccineus TaxID=3886 RepID=A0AAN9ML45_PHACN